MGETVAATRKKERAGEFKKYLILILESHFEDKSRLEQHFLEDDCVVTRCRTACVCTRGVCRETCHSNHGEVISQRVPTCCPNVG